jgi:signal transduction histidine kinase
VTVDVVDEGPGVPEEVRKAAFRPFASAGVAGVGRPAGIGLGLSLAHEVARAHDGQLTLVRSDSRGTVFRFQLPVVRKHHGATR